MSGRSDAFAAAWSPLRHHATQHAFWTSDKRFQIVVAGRRSGKSELSKRKLVRRACAFHAHRNGLFVYAAPTRPQVKRIAWADLKALVPRDKMLGRPRESELEIKLVNGASIVAVGMDKPQRVEGSPIDGAVCDEFADWKERAWVENLSPSLTNFGREGWAILTGVPGGRNHYWREQQKALADIAKLGAASQYGVYHWKSAEILSREQIEFEKGRLDELTFRQEWEASFVTFEGRVYYPFEREVHASESLLPRYDPRQPLLIDFDFNTAPGVAVISQEIRFHPDRPGYRPEIAREIDAVIGEVWIERNSNTPAVCRKLVADWGPNGRNHLGPVVVCGDATGGARKTSSVDGSDWEIVRAELKGKFAGGVRYEVPRENPPERGRVNATNSLLRSTDGKVHLLVDPVGAPHVVEDFEGVVWLKGGDEIEKIPGGKLTHLTDAKGYGIWRRYPLLSGRDLGYRAVG